MYKKKIYIYIYTALGMYLFVFYLCIYLFSVKSYNTCEHAYTYVCYTGMCVYTYNYIHVYTYAQTDRVRVYGLSNLRISGFSKHVGCDLGRRTRDD